MEEKKISAQDKRQIQLGILDHIELNHPEMRDLELEVDVSPCGRFASVREVRRPS